MSEKHAPLITIKNLNKKILKRAVESCGHMKKLHLMLDVCLKIDAPCLFLLLKLSSSKKIVLEKTKIFVLQRLTS